MRPETCRTLFLAGILLFVFSCASQRKEEKQNRLSASASPYLREHADNPVDWYEWGPEALEKAKSENKPILISIGYASCHWCHVMERESFMDTAVARLMNQNFVCIKVDREERPDIDQVYMKAIQIISGNGGWPLNAFALPDGKPFYAGTYFPKETWTNVLAQISAAYKNNYRELVEQAGQITRGVGTAELIPATDVRADWSMRRYREVLSGWQTSIDYQAGGLTGAPKFPMPSIWEFAMQDYYLTGDPKALSAVTVTLDAMAGGGICDQLGGGFARYSTDAAWRVPHFEKMLYDNGQLVSLYAHALQLTRDKKYEVVIHETLDFIKREMTSLDGGFYSSINADSEGEEGKYYVWTKAEIEKQLPENAAKQFMAFYNVTDSGNWEGRKNILYRSVNDEVLGEWSLSQPGMRSLLDQSRVKLLEVREQRVRPTRDEKILTAWNALMMLGYIDAYQATGESTYLDAALANARFLEKKMLRSNKRLWRNFMDGNGSIDGFLEDYAMLANAYIHLYQVTFDLHWLTLAREITDYAIAHFGNEKTGLYFFSPDESSELIARKIYVADNVIPSSNSTMATVLFQLGEYYDEEKYRSESLAMLTMMSATMSQEVAYYSNWAKLAGLVSQKPFEVAIVGADAAAVAKKLQANYLPTALFLGGKQENLPLLENKLVVDKTIIYVCRDKVCKLPVLEAEVAMQQLKVN